MLLYELASKNTKQILIHSLKEMLLFMVLFKFELFFTTITALKSTLTYSLNVNYPRLFFDMTWPCAWLDHYCPASIYQLNVNDRNTRARCETCPRLTIKTTTPMASFWYLCCLLWTYFPPCSSVSIVNFRHAIAGVLTVLLQQDHLYKNYLIWERHRKGKEDCFRIGYLKCPCETSKINAV